MGVLAWTLGLGLFGGAYALFGRKRYASSSSTQPTATPPAWIPGPGNEGRIYGQPSVDLPGAFYGGNGILVAPDCAWLVEGDAFLPTGDATVFPSVSASSLASALGMGLPGSTAWSFVKGLVDEQGLSPADAAVALLNAAASLSAEVGWPLLTGASVPTPACALSPTPAIAAWLADTSARISDWLAVRPAIHNEIIVGGVR